MQETMLAAEPITSEIKESLLASEKLHPGEGCQRNLMEKPSKLPEGKKEENNHNHNKRTLARYLGGPELAEN